MNGARTMRMSIPSSLDNVSLVGNAVKGVLEGEPGPRKDVPLVELAVCEAVNNAIIHAYGRKPDFTVDVDLTLAQGLLTVTVADTGTSFAFPGELPPIPTGEDLGDMPLGGWGLRIMGEVMERVEYHSRDGRNELTMSRRWG